MRQKLVKLVILVVVVAVATHAAPVLAACCSITSVDPRTGVVKAREGASGRTFEFTVTDARQRSSLRVGQAVEADFGAQMAWVPPLTARYRISNLSSPGGGLAAPGAIVKRVALPELLSVILWVPQINLAGPQPAQQAGAVLGGIEARGAVFLTAPAVGNAVVALASGNTALLHVPPSVTVAAGAQSAQFRYDPMPVAAPTTATVSASYRGQTKTASVTVLPPAVKAITLDPSTLQGGAQANGMVWLSSPGPSGTPLKVALVSNHPAAQVPTEVVLNGVERKGFQITTRGVGQQTPVLISGSFAGTKRDATLTVTPARLKIFGYYSQSSASVSSIGGAYCYPQGQSGNYSYSGKFPLGAELTGPGPLDGSGVIQLKSSNASLLRAPGTLPIPPNGTLASTELTCLSPSAESLVEITGSYLGETMKYVVRVKPLLMPDLTISAVTLYDLARNVITRPTDPQPFDLCPTLVDQAAAVSTVTQTILRVAYQHSRGSSKQTDRTVGYSGGWPPVCERIPGLEVGEYVDVTLTVDPLNTTVESNEGNNVRQLRVSR